MHYCFLPEQTVYSCRAYRKFGAPPWARWCAIWETADEMNFITLPGEPGRYLDFRKGQVLAVNSILQEDPLADAHGI